MARSVGGAVSCASLALLAVSASLTAEAEGHGTHLQLGMPACSWAERFNMPCATCGMTTSFAHAADGDLVASFLNQPMGAALAIMTAVVFWASAHVALTGSRIGELTARMIGGKTLLAAGILMVGAWVYKIITWQG